MSEGGATDPLWSPCMKIGSSQATKPQEKHKLKKRDEVPKLTGGLLGGSWNMVTRAIYKGKYTYKYLKPQVRYL